MTGTTLNSSYLRDQAQRCRRLADSIADERARETLLALAEEYETRAVAQVAPWRTRVDWES